MAGGGVRIEVVESHAIRCLLAGVGPGATSAARPVLCFLHGYDEGPPTDIREGLTRHGPLAPGNVAGVTRRFIVVAPQLPARGDLWARHAGDVHRIVTDVHQRYGGDAGRTYLTGFSFGANGVFDLALARPDPWAALWAVDPTRVPSRDPGRPVWLSVGRVARPGTARFERALGLEPPGAGPAGDRVCLDEGADHVGSATLAYGDRRIYTWLLGRSLPG